MHGSFQPLNARLSPAVTSAFPPTGHLIRTCRLDFPLHLSMLLRPILTATLSRHCCPTRCLRVFKELWKSCNANKMFRPVEICNLARQLPYMQGRHTAPALFPRSADNALQYAPSVRSRARSYTVPSLTRVSVHRILSLASFKEAMVLDMLLPVGTTRRASSSS